MAAAEEEVRVRLMAAPAGGCRSPLPFAGPVSLLYVLVREGDLRPGYVPLTQAVQALQEAAAQGQDLRALMAALAALARIWRLRLGAQAQPPPLEEGNGALVPLSPALLRAVAWLEEREREALARVTRPCVPLPEAERSLGSPEDLAAAAARVVARHRRRRRIRALWPLPQLGPLWQAARDLLQALRRGRTIWLPPQGPPSQRAAFLLVGLELARRRRGRLVQEAPYGPVCLVPPSLGDGDWSG